MNEKIKEIKTMQGIYTETIGNFEIKTDYVDGIKHGISTVTQNSVVIQTTTWDNGKMTGFKRNVQVGPTNRTKLQEMEINEFGSIVTKDKGWVSHALNLNNGQMMWFNRCSPIATLAWSQSDAIFILGREHAIATKSQRIQRIDETDMPILVESIANYGKLTESEIGYLMLKYL